MSTTPTLGIQLWDTGITQADVVFNDALRRLDVLTGLKIVSRTTNAQPGSPAEGDAYVITGAATGAIWTTYAQHDIAYYSNAAWVNYVPAGRILLVVADETDLMIYWDGAAWTTFPFVAEGTAILSTGETGAVKFLREDGDNTCSWQPIPTAATDTIWIPAAAMQPTVSNGCAALANVETTAGRPDQIVLDFDTAADEHAQFQVAFPKRWNLGTVTFQVFWTTVGAVTTGVAWGLQGVAVSDNETIDVAYGTAVVVTDDAQGATEEMLVTAESGAVTIAGTPADNDVCFFRVFRDVSDANDDMTQDARLIGIKLFYTIDAGTDA